MGIKDLFKFIKKEHSDCYNTYNINEYLKYFLKKNKRVPRVSIDCDYWLMKTASFMNLQAAQKYKKEIIDAIFAEEDFFESSIFKKEFYEILKNEFVLFLGKILSNNIEIVLVFDGSFRKEKLSEIESRREAKAKRKEKEIEKRDQLIDEPSNLNENFNAWLKIKCQDVRLTKQIKKDLKKFLKEDLQIPVINAIHDGEKMCACLCREGLCDIVLSGDSDSVALLAPLVCPDIDFKGKTIDIINVKKLIKQIAEQNDLSKKKARKFFLDFCIMCGCDFNTNIKGIGPVKSLKLLKQHKKIENVPLDTECLNYETCRELFSYEDTQLQEEDVYMDIEISYEYIKDYFKESNRRPYFYRLT